MIELFKIRGITEDFDKNIDLFLKRANQAIS